MRELAMQSALARWTPRAQQVTERRPRRSRCKLRRGLHQGPPNLPVHASFIWRFRLLRASDGRVVALPQAEIASEVETTIVGNVAHIQEFAAGSAR